VQRLRPAVICFQRIESRQARLQFRIRNLPDTREQRLLFIGRVLGCRFPEITKSKIEGTARLFREFPVTDIGNGA